MIDASQASTSTATTTELEDLTAAALLTSLLHNSTANNSSGSATSGTSRPHSPTPSHASSFNTDHYAPSSMSASSTSRHEQAPGMSVASPRGSFSMPSSQASSYKGDGLLKSTSTTDAENAAEMMLYLATSPSPARPTVRRPDQRILSRNAGRVLFPSGATGEEGAGSDEQRQPRIGVAGPSRQVAYSMYERPSEMGGIPIPTGTSSHVRTRTAPDSIYAGDLLPSVGPIVSPRSSSLHSSPRSPATAHGGEDSQSFMGFADSQETRVDEQDVGGDTMPMKTTMRSPKGKERESSYEDNVSSMRISSPMSVDGSQHYRRPSPNDKARWGGLIDASIASAFSPSRRSSDDYEATMGMGMGMSDVRGVGLEDSSMRDSSPHIPPGASIPQQGVVL